MGNRRFAQVTSDDEDEDEADPKPAKRITRSSKNSKETESEPKNKRRKVVKLNDEDDDEKEEKPTNKKESSRRKEDKEGGGGERDGEEDQEVEEQEEEEEEEEPQEEAKPIGNLIRITGKGRGQKKHYDSFEFDGNQYVLEDPVLLVPEETDQKPYVAIIKDITQNKDGSIMVTGQWFYRPEEAQKKGGGSWQSRDTRELFYSFHRDDIPAESVMHKCVVHFVPAHKQLPKRKQHPGFIVQKVYDTVERKLWRLTDKDYEDSKQNEIDLLVKKTMERLGDLPDLEPEEAQINQEDQLKSKRSIRRKNVPPLDVSRDEESNKSDQQPKAETPGSCTGSEYNAILVQFKALTGESHRDKWLEKLLQGVQHICSTDGIDNEKDSKSSDTVNESQDLNSKGVKPFEWPDAALPAIVALEKASHDTLSSDFQKYNQKMRSLAFNLKNNAFLAQRLLKGELEPLKILNMSPSELKEGLTAEETATTEPEESASMQMTDARCSRCNESKVGVRDIIQAGHGDRYQLECTACGHSWYASRDEASTLTIDGPSSTRSVGTAPWATAKFESIEKQLASPRASDLSASGNEALKKSSEAFVPVLERQKSPGKS